MDAFLLLSVVCYFFKLLCAQRWRKLDERVVRLYLQFPSKILGEKLLVVGSQNHVVLNAWHVLIERVEDSHEQLR